MKPSFLSRAAQSLVPLSLIALTVSTARAADTLTETQGSAFAVDNADLLQTSLASISDSLTYNSSYNPSGKSAADLSDGDLSGEPVIENGTLTFNLNTTSACATRTTLWFS